MKLPENINSTERKYLKEVYHDTYKRNLSKGKDKAKAYAKAKFYEECFKIFCVRENVASVRDEWLNKKNDYKIIKRLLAESIDYKVYKLNNIKLIVSTDKKILDKFPNAERSGMIRDMNDEYEQEILFKVKSKHGVRLHPDMYYIIK